MPCKEEEDEVNLEGGIKTIDVASYMTDLTCNLSRKEPKRWQNLCQRVQSIKLA